MIHRTNNNNSSSSSTSRSLSSRSFYNRARFVPFEISSNNNKSTIFLLLLVLSSMMMMLINPSSSWTHASILVNTSPRPPNLFQPFTFFPNYMQQPPVQYLDNSIHVLNIPDQNNAKLELYIFYTYPTSFVGSNVFSVLSKCGVKQNQYFQQVVNATQYFNCNFTSNKGYATTLEVYSKSGNFTEGVYFVEIGPSAYLKLKGINDMTAQFEIIVYSTDGLSEILKKPANLLQPPNTELYVNITIPPIAVIDPSNPPALDALTGQPFIPMGANFALNARLGGKVPRGTTLRYNWQFTKVESDSLGALDLMLRKNSSLPSNFVNTLQPMIQENSLGFSSIVLSQDKHMELQSLYKVSCFVTDLRNRILTKSSIYLRTPRDFYLRNLAQDPMSVFPKNASFTQLFRFSGQNIQYADFTSPSTVLYAYGYLDPLMTKSLTLDVLRNRFSEIPMSELMTVAVRVTDFSTNPIQYAYLPPSFRQVPGQAAPNITVDFESIHYSYKHQLVMFVKDADQSFTKIFLLRDAVCVFPTDLNSVLTFVNQQNSSFSLMQLKGIMGVTQRMYQYGDIQVVDQIQRALFTRIQTMISNMTVQDTSKMVDIARIIEMWSYNATNSVKLMAADMSSTILSTFSKFFTLLRTDASNNRVTGNNVDSMPLGMRDSSIFSSLASTLSNMIPLSGMKSQTPSLVKLFSSTIVDSLSPSEEKRLTTSSLYFTIRKDYAANFNGTSITDDSENANGVLMPSISLFNDTAGLYGTELVTYLENPNPSTTNNGTATIQSSVVSLRCINAAGNYLPLSGLSEPLVLTFNVSATELDKPNATVSCKYWNETVSDWKEDGCQLTSKVKISNYYILSCSCDHTTQFATFVEFTSYTNYTTEQKTAYYILWGFDIGIGLLFVIVSATILILIIIFKDSQPVKAKYIAPFVGMTSILLESFLSYIVKASIMIGLTASGTNTPFGLNTITYVSSIIVSVAFCVTVLTFVIQVVRYQLMRRMYAFMSDENLDDQHVNKKISFYRWISSKKLYVTSVVFISVLIFVIFAGLSLGRIGQEVAQSNYASQSFTSTIYTIVTSSIMGSILVMSLVTVIIIFLFDLLYCLIYEYRAKPIVDTSIQVPSYDASTASTIELSDISSGEKSTKKKLLDDFYIKKAKDLTLSSMYRFFIQEDPLFFRVETLLFILCLGVLLTSYIFGIVSLGFFISTNSALDTSTSAFNKSLIMDIVRLILSVVYFVLYVLVFGDLSLLVYIFKYRSKHARNLKTMERAYDRSAESLESGNSFASSHNELHEILQDPLALRLFEKFTVKEFSKENLICYHQLVELYTIHKLREKESTEQVKLLEGFIGKFLTAASAFEVNIPSHTRTSLLKTVKEKQNVNSQQILKALDSLKGDLIQNLSDTFSRFVTTKSYQYWVKIKLEKQQLMNANKLN